MRTIIGQNSKLRINLNNTTSSLEPENGDINVVKVSKDELLRGVNPPAYRF